MKFYKYFAISALGHIVFFALFYSLILLWKHSAMPVMDIDLTGSSLLLRPLKNIEKKPLLYNEKNDWFIGKAVKQAVPKKTPVVAEEKPAECPPPCPDNPGDWIETGSLSRRPVWAEGMIIESDYPQDARRQGKEGRVLAEVFIDAGGKVRDVKIIESNDSRFTALVVEKLTNAKFEPALDKSGRPSAVRMILPVVFELK